MDPKIYKAVAIGDYKYIKTLNLSNWNELKDMKTYKGNNILHIAAEYRTHYLITKTIISNCKSLLHEQNFNGDTPLHFAVRQFKLINVRLLIREREERKKLLRIVNEKGDTALHDAVRSCNFKAVELLIKADEELACFNNNEGESPLFVAVDKTYYRIARHILKAAPACSYVGRKGMNVLHAAAIRSKPSTFYIFAHPFCQFLLWVSPLCCIIFKMWELLAVMLIAYLFLVFLNRVKFSTIGSGFFHEVYKRYPSAISEADQFGWIPLHYAAHIGNWQVIEQILKLDSSELLLDMKDNEGLSAFHIAAKGNQTFVLRQLLRKYPHVKYCVDYKGRTALHVASESEEGNVKVILLLASPRICGCLLNEGDINGNTPLHLAALQEHTAICKLLIKKPQINSRAINNAGLTAIDIIKSKGMINLKSRRNYVASLEDFFPRKKTTEGVIVNGEEHREAPRKPKHPQEAYKEMANINLIIVALVATVTFTAALTVPGGFNTDDDNAGTAILTKKAAFRAFVTSNSLAFGFSSALLSLRVWIAARTKREDPKTVLKWSLKFRNYAVLAMVVAFLSGQYAVLSNSHSLAASAVAIACVAYFYPNSAIVWEHTPHNLSSV